MFRNTKFIFRCCGRLYGYLQNLVPAAVVEPYSHRSMTTNTGEQHRISRINNQVNYERKFCSRKKVTVTIPSLPYEAFALAGTGIKPWKLIDLVVSVRLFTQYPVKHAGNPCDSIVDTHLLMKENILFLVALRIDINRLFHDDESPKFPLTVDAEVTHAGNTSTRRLFTVKHTSVSTPYITYVMDDVIVNKRSRRPEAFPDWWVKKYSGLVKPKTRLEKPTKPDYAVSKSEIKVEYEHIDHNQHTNTGAYLKFCMNAAFKTAMSERHGYLKSEHLRAGLKTIQMFLHGESNFGDTLIVETFQTEIKGNEIFFEVRKRDERQKKDLLCCTVVFEFYEPLKHEINSKL